MDEKLGNKNMEATEEKVDLSKVPNRMFDENPDTFTEAEFMNRDYLNHIYGEDMGFLNKEIRQSREEYYKERQELKDTTATRITQEKKRMLIYTVVFLVVSSPVTVTIVRMIISMLRYYRFMDSDMLGAMNAEVIQAKLIADGFFVSAIWIFFAIELAIYGIVMFSSVRKIKQWKYGLENALKRLDDSKEEYKIEGLYDTE